MGDGPAGKAGKSEGREQSRSQVRRVRKGQVRSGEECASAVASAQPREVRLLDVEGVSGVRREGSGRDHYCGVAGLPGGCREKVLPRYRQRIADVLSCDIQRRGGRRSSREKPG